MKISVEGVDIELTPQQVALIEKEKKKREKVARSGRKEFNTLKKILRHFGFKPLNGGKDGFFQEEYNWYADIIHRGTDWYDVWMVGPRLRSSRHFPGGWMYYSPEEVQKVLTTAIDDFKNNK